MSGAKWRTRGAAAPGVLLEAVGIAALLTVVGAVGVNVVARHFGLPMVGAGLVAEWALVPLTFAALAAALPLDKPLALLPAGFALAVAGWGLFEVADRVGGTDAVLGIRSFWRYAFAAILAAGALVAGFVRATPMGVLALGSGAALAFVPLPVPPLAAVAGFALALAVRTPVALALIAAVALSGLPVRAIAQNLVRGVGESVLIAVPLFVFAASLLVAGGLGRAVVDAARALAGRRPGALAKANVGASVLFGGVSGSSIADAAMNARLLVPAMIAAGTPGGQAVAITAASAVLPNLLPPSIALLLAAAATDQSVGALWTAGIGAGLVAAVALILAVRFTTRDLPTPPPPPLRWATLAAPLALVVGVVGSLRFGLATAAEAGLIAVVLAGVYAAWHGPGRLVAAVREASAIAGAVMLLIAAATPVSFLIATSGFDAGAVIPAAAPALALAVGVAIALAAGVVLDVGAAILLLLPVLLPPLQAVGNDPVHATLVLTLALLIGGLTPPVGVLVLTASAVSGVTGGFRAVWPYGLALLAAVAVLALAPPLTAGLSRL